MLRLITSCDLLRVTCWLVTSWSHVCIYSTLLGSIYGKFKNLKFLPQLIEKSGCGLTCLVTYNLQLTRADVVDLLACSRVLLPSESECNSQSRWLTYHSLWDSVWVIRSFLTASLWIHTTHVRYMYCASVSLVTHKIKWNCQLFNRNCISFKHLRSFTVNHLVSFSSTVQSLPKFLLWLQHPLVDIFLLCSKIIIWLNVWNSLFKPKYWWFLIKTAHFCTN